MCLCVGLLDLGQMIKTYITKCGTGENCWQVFINGYSRDEVEPIYWSLFNHGATSNPDPEWADENTLVFWTKKARLIRAFRCSAINMIANKYAHKFEGKRGALIPALADKLAARRLRHCVSKPYVRPLSVSNLDHVHSIGTIRAEKPDSDYRNRETL